VRIAHVDEIAAEEEGPGDERRWKPVRATLGIDAFGANAFVADAGQLIVHLADPAPSAVSGWEADWAASREPTG
jgi:hypothetical protein